MSVDKPSHTVRECCLSDECVGEGCLSECAFSQEKKTSLMHRPCAAHSFHMFPSLHTCVCGAEGGHIGSSIFHMFVQMVLSMPPPPHSGSQVRVVNQVAFRGIPVPPLTTTPMPPPPQGGESTVSQGCPGNGHCGRECVVRSGVGQH